MSEQNAPPSASHRFRWKTVGLAIALWLGGCTLAGLAVAAWSREHGSILFLGFGVFVAVAGAAAHAALLFAARFRELPMLGQTLALWACTTVLLAAIGIVFAISSDNPSKYREALTVVFLYAALPALAAAGVFNWLVNRAVA